jgi:uncharacterized membrane protein YecN with MAPEG domain
MTPHYVLPITLTMAGASALLTVWLGMRVGRMRHVHKVSIGDGGVEPLTARMRAQANFVEYAPFFLILVAAIEMARGSELWLWAAGALFIVARILHALGMDRPPGNRFRTIGAVATGIVLVALAAYALAIPYLERLKPVSTDYAVAAAHA